jgi:hypothetical protein
VKRPLIFLAFVLAVSQSITGSSVAFQEDENDPVRAVQLIKNAVRARGGDAYLKIRTTVTEGQFTAFEKGVSGNPQPFIDYIVYPDRERTEFGKGKNKFIQTNSGAAGWVYDSAQKMIREQNDEQVKRFQQGIRHDLDNLLQRGWSEDGAKLVYVGRREAWKNAFSEAVRIDFADGNSVTIHFDTRSGLPMMTEYKRGSGPTSTREQVRFFRWVDFGGIQYATIQDSYRDDVQIGRVSYDSVRFNEPVPDKLFEKPQDAKKVK